MGILSLCSFKREVDNSIKSDANAVTTLKEDCVIGHVPFNLDQPISLSLVSSQ